MGRRTGERNWETEERGREEIRDLPQNGQRFGKWRWRVEKKTLAGRRVQTAKREQKS